jgi:hypothetical protein
VEAKNKCKARKVGIYFLGRERRARVHVGGEGRGGGEGGGEGGGQGGGGGEGGGGGRHTVTVSEKTTVKYS